MTVTIAYGDNQTMTFTNVLDVSVNKMSIFVAYKDGAKSMTASVDIKAIGTYTLTVVPASN